MVWLLLHINIRYLTDVWGALTKVSDIAKMFALLNIAWYLCLHGSEVHD